MLFIRKVKTDSASNYTLNFVEFNHLISMLEKYHIKYSLNDDFVSFDGNEWNTFDISTNTNNGCICIYIINDTFSYYCERYMQDSICSIKSDMFIY